MPGTGGHSCKLLPRKCQMRCEERWSCRPSGPGTTAGTQQGSARRVAGIGGGSEGRAAWQGSRPGVHLLYREVGVRVHEVKCRQE